MTDPVEIARGLSEAQKRALLWLPERGPVWWDGWSCLSARSPDAPDSKKFKKLREHGLCESCAGNQRHRATPLGLAVRTALTRLAEEGDARDGE